MGNVLSWLQAAVAYFADEPLRLLTVIGGSGGLAYWWDRIRNRPRVRLRILVLTPYSFEFEAENTSLTPNSLIEAVKLTGYTVLRDRRVWKFELDAVDRGLPPMQSQRFTAKPARGQALSEDLHHLLFLTVAVRPTRGRMQRLRFRSHRLEALGHAAFLLQFLTFYIVGQVRIDLAWRSVRQLPLRKARAGSGVSVWFRCRVWGEYHPKPEIAERAAAFRATGRLEVVCPTTGQTISVYANDFVEMPEQGR